MKSDLEGKKLLILGGNPETIPLVEIANSWGIKTIVASDRESDPAKAYAWKAYTYEGLNTAQVIQIATQEQVDGVLVGVADILVPMYLKVCEALDFPCYVTRKSVEVFAYKDIFKATCERFGVHGIPEFYLDEEMRREDLDKIEYPVMVKPVDNGGGVGMTVAYNEDELRRGVAVALENSHSRRFIVEKYMLIWACIIPSRTGIVLPPAFTTATRRGSSRDFRVSVSAALILPSIWMSIFRECTRTRSGSLRKWASGTAC